MKTTSYPSGKKLLQSLVLDAGNIKRILEKETGRINLPDLADNYACVLDLGIIPAAEFEVQFNQRLAQAFTQYLLQQCESLKPEQEVQSFEKSSAKLSVLPEEQELYILAVSCLQPAGQQSALARYDKHQLPLLLRQLLASGGQQPPVPALFYRRITPSRMAVAALLYLLNNSQGRQLLATTHPTTNQLQTWEKAIADGEIFPELVVQLMIAPLSAQQSEATRRWLLPLWQKKAVRYAVSHHAGKASAVDIDAYFRLLSQRPAQQQPQDMRQEALRFGQQPQDLRQEALRSQQSQDFRTQQQSQQVSNAGLVLLWPLLPQLFSLLAFCEEGEFSSDNARWHAVTCLDWLVWAEEQPAAGRLSVNKLLCGIAPETPSPDLIPLSPQQQQLTDDWLAAISRQLPAWQKFSLADIRQLFLQRPGEIITETQPPQIVVKPESFDLLLGDWPWPLTLAKFPWLEQPLTLIWPFHHQTG